MGARVVSHSLKAVVVGQDAALWVEVQKANWDDVILKQQFKDQIQSDVNGFYSQGKIYKDLGIPWKRGILMHGPPGKYSQIKPHERAAYRKCR